ncbi:MAG: SPOR domain-containing protein, partial [Crocinitomicaceae bacterium]
DTLTSEASESEEVIEEPVAEKPVVEEPVKAPVPTNSKTGYHIIVGSFGNPENAERFAAKLRSEGANTSLIQENGMHRVSLGSFNTRDEAKSALNSMKLSVSAIIHKVD